MSGKVHRPGVRRLPAGSRVEDALEAAGGVRAGTDVTGRNRARVLVDGEQVAVGLPPGPPVAGATAGGGAGAGPSAPLSLNSATAEQFETLPGVGPVLAQHMIDYRTENNGFRSVDELRQVNGIGDRRLRRPPAARTAMSSREAGLGSRDVDRDRDGTGNAGVAGEGPRREGPTDLRLVPPALAVWAAAAVTLGLSGRWAVVVAVTCSALALVLLVASARAGRSHVGRAAGRSRVLVAGGAVLLCAAASATTTSLEDPPDRPHLVPEDGSRGTGPDGAGRGR
ncbi:hypothetical protein SVIOM74S_03789 [Streptomyces violarus]